MALSPGGGTRNPPGFTGQRRDLTIECHARFYCHERTFGACPVAIRSVHLFGFPAGNSDSDRDSGSPQLRDASATHERIGINRPHHDMSDTGANDGGYTGWRALIQMTAGFERHVQRRAFCQAPRLLKREDFGVRSARDVMVSLAHHPATGHYESPDHRIGAGLAASLIG